MQTELESLRFVDASARHLVGVADDFSLETRSGIPGLWQSFFASGHEITDVVEGAMFGVSFDQDGKGNFRYGVAREVSTVPEALPEGLCRMHLTEGTYAVLGAFGPIEDLPVQMDRMYNDWLPGPDYAMRPGACFERYPDDARNSPEAMVYEIWVPVSKRS